MSRDDIQAIFVRLDHLPYSERESILWRTLGGCEHLAEFQPNARIGQLFIILDRHVSAVEKKPVAA